MEGNQDPPTGASFESLPAWFQEHARKTDERFANLSEVLHKRTSARVDVQKTEAPPPQSITAEDLTAALRLGELRAALPDGVRTRVDQFREAHGFGRAVVLAETIAETLATVSTTTPPPAPRAKGASPSSPAARSLPSTQSEFYAIASRDPALADEIARDPLFDFSRLPKF